MYRIDKSQTLARQDGRRARAMTDRMGGDTSGEERAANEGRTVYGLDRHDVPFRKDQCDIIVPHLFRLKHSSLCSSSSASLSSLSDMSPTPSLKHADSISLDIGGDAAHLIVVSNRLPITISKDAQGEYHFKMSSGGLVSALSGCKKSMSFTWIGWPGFFIPPKDRPIVDKRLMEEYSCQAVYLDDDVADRHYNGFSNSILWPLFHYHPGEMSFEEENWQAYRQANFAFAEAIMKQLQPGSMVWVQDYHLMLLPMLLRTLNEGPTSVGEATQNEIAKILEGVQSEEIVAPKISGIKIGFFLHTPFPSSEIYR